MTEKEKMLAGKIYDPIDPELVKIRTAAHVLSFRYSALSERQTRKREKILKKLLPNRGEGCYFQGPVYFDYGVFTTFGKGCFANYHLTVLDVCPVTIGDNVFFGPNVSIYTPKHPFLPEERNVFFDKEKGYDTDMEYGAPITIGSDCWIAGNVTVLAGVTIGKGCVIGAGSVVAKDIPDGVFACGNPCRPVRPITKEDSVRLKRELF